MRAGAAARVRRRSTTGWSGWGRRSPSSSSRWPSAPPLQKSPPPDKMEQVSFSFLYFYSTVHMQQSKIYVLTNHPNTAEVQYSVIYFYTFYVNNRQAKTTIKRIYRARQKSSRAASVVLLQHNAYCARGCLKHKVHLHRPHYCKSKGQLIYTFFKDEG